MRCDYDTKYGTALRIYASAPCSSPRNSFPPPFIYYITSPRAVTQCVLFFAFFFNTFRGHLSEKTWRLWTGRERVSLNKTCEQRGHPKLTSAAQRRQDVQQPPCRSSPPRWAPPWWPASGGGWKRTGAGTNVRRNQEKKVRKIERNRLPPLSSREDAETRRPRPCGSTE